MRPQLASISLANQLQVAGEFPVNYLQNTGGGLFRMQRFDAIRKPKNIASVTLGTRRRILPTLHSLAMLFMPQTIRCFRTFQIFLHALVFSAFAAQPCLAQTSVKEKSLQAFRQALEKPRPYKAQLSPGWIDEGNRFWYQNNLKNGKKEFVLVDAVKGTRSIVDRPPGRSNETSSSDVNARVLADPSQATGNNAIETSIRFLNNLNETVAMFWVSGNQRKEYHQLQPGQSIDQHTFAGHVWEAKTVAGKRVALFEAVEPPSIAKIEFGLPISKPGKRERQRRRLYAKSRSLRGANSPDGKWNFRIEDGNVVLRLRAGTPDGIQVTDDGSSKRPYRLAQWSPDSKTLVAFHMTPGDDTQVHLIESSPDGGGPAKLSSRSYPLPGDRFDSYKLTLISVDDQQAVQPDVDPIDFGTPRIRWNQDGSRFTYRKVDRGHQRLRLMEVDPSSKNIRTIVDEKSDTFIWTAHSDAIGMRLFTFLENSNELIYSSEKDGYRHLHLVDLETKTQTAITSGDWVVRGIDEVDEQNRQIWFRASGLYDDQDPYFVHHCRINFDGTEWVRLTRGNGTHSVQYSPDRRFLIDSYSRVDQPPIHELRRTSDGELICELESADASAFTKLGKSLPEPFVAKGRDGKTDIWGNIYRPDNFDPDKSYPIIEDIYAGPHDAFVPKQFQLGNRYRDLTNQGFIVVKIDGMGTAHRGKAFHDVCWHNLKDAGFPDRIAWIRAAAKKYPYMDANRVGIFGTSAGGQNAAGAVMFHSDFYKAAVASCGCHDNRMDKASWNEQWMGFPVGPHYAESSNVDNANRLGGKLMLIVGELDQNVPPESTLRVVDALIKANKDFDLLVIPGLGHSSGGSYGQRRRVEFFQRHLINSPSPSQGSALDAGLKDTSKDDTDQARAQQVPSDEERASLTNRVSRIEAYYQADLGSLTRFHDMPESQTRFDRLSQFYRDWVKTLESIDQQSLPTDEQASLDQLIRSIRDQRQSLGDDFAQRKQVLDLLPFASSILQLAEARQRVDPVDAKAAAATVSELTARIDAATESIAKDSNASESPHVKLNDQAALATEIVANLRRYLRSWKAFYTGYDPSFSWWLKTPVARTDASLKRLLNQFTKIETSASKQIRPTEVTASTTDAKPTDAKPTNDSKQSEYSTEIASFAADALNLTAANARNIAQNNDAFDKSATILPEILRSYQASLEDSESDSDKTPDQQLTELHQANLDKLSELDFESLTRADRVDYVLFQNELHYRLNKDRIAAEQSSSGPRLVQDDSGISGYPVGADALQIELDHEMIAYTPAELIAIAEKEYEWCLAELKKASREMGLGDDWQSAVEKVKSMHVEPGQQPQLIRQLAHSSIEFIESNQWLTIPPLAKETWRMQMMTPQRQRINPFFTGGEVISVSYPTDTMTHRDKLQSMRGNNVPFAKATVHHELIPGHHLQAFMSDRHQSHRQLFRTPFWTEGWALYWEMLLYDAGFPVTPQEKIGFLVWRSHRCARIIFSLSFHLGRMTPVQCVDLLVKTVGFDRNNAAAEVRRSVGPDYSPLYQAAYMLGGIQIRELRSELVDQGQMTPKQFHDAVLKENCMPISMLRAILTGETITRDFQPEWKFY